MTPPAAQQTAVAPPPAGANRPGINRMQSRLDLGSPVARENTETNRALAATLAERMQWAIDGGTGRQRSIERHHGRGKVMVRDRIDLVIDRDTSFLELSTHR